MGYLDDLAAQQGLLTPPAPTPTPTPTQTPQPAAPAFKPTGRRLDDLAVAQGLVPPPAPLPAWNEASVNAGIRAIRSFAGTPYKWGGREPGRGADCSGLIQCSFESIGLKLPRTAAEQYKATQRIDEGQLQPLDLVFFQNTGGRKGITHVGVYLGNGRIAEMSSSSKAYVETDLNTPYHRKHLAGFGTVRHDPDKYRLPAVKAEAKAAEATAKGTPEDGRTAFVQNYKGAKLSAQAVDDIRAWFIQKQPGEKLEDLLVDVQQAHPGWNPEAVKYAYLTLRLGKDDLERLGEAQTPLVKANRARQQAIAERAALMAGGDPTMGLLTTPAAPLSAADTQRARESAQTGHDINVAALKAAAAVAGGAAAPGAAMKLAQVVTKPGFADAAAKAFVAGKATQEAASEVARRRAAGLQKEGLRQTAPQGPIQSFGAGVLEGELQRAQGEALWSGDRKRAAEIEQKVKAAARPGGSEEMKSLSVWQPEWWKAALRDKGSAFVYELGVQTGRQYPEMLGAILGGIGGAAATKAAAAAATGAAGVAGVGSFDVERKASYGEMLKESGVDLADEKSIADFVRNPKAVAALKARAQKRGLAVASVDTVVDALTGHAIANVFGDAARTTAQKAGRTALAGAGQFSGEAGSESAGKLAEGKNPLSPAELNDVLLEAVFGLGNAAAMTGAQVGMAAAAQAPAKAVQAAAAAKEEAVGVNRQVPPAFASSPKVTPRKTAEGKWTAVIEGEAVPGEFDDAMSALDNATTSPIAQVAALKRALKETPSVRHAEFTPMEDGSIRIKAEGGAETTVRVESDEFFAQREQQERKAYEASQETLGAKVGAGTGAFYDRDTNTMYLREGYDIGEISHETVHWLRKSGIVTSRELLDMAHYGRKRYGRAFDAANDVSVEEAAAYALQFATREEKRPASIRKVVSKVADFLRALTSSQYRAGRRMVGQFNTGYVQARPVAQQGPQQAAQAAQPAPEAPVPTSPAAPPTAPTQEQQADAERGVIINGVRRTLADEGYFLFDPRHANFDPARFQYKGNADRETGSTNSLAGAKAWNKDLQGVILMWRDPADGKVYVVNGHNRTAKAAELGVETLVGKLIDAPDAKTARTIGALTNIADERGTPIDAAKVFRDEVFSDAELEQMGIDMSKSLVTKGRALAALNKNLFEMVVNDKLHIDSAIIIGRVLPHEYAKQQVLMEQIVKSEEWQAQRATHGPKKIPADELQAWAETYAEHKAEKGQAAQGRIAGTSGVQGAGQAVLGGDEFDQIISVGQFMAKIIADVRNRLKYDKGLYGRISTKRAAEALKSKMGVQVDTGQGEKLTAKAEALLAEFNLAWKLGLKPLIEHEAVRLKSAKTKDAKQQVLDDAYATVTQSIIDQIEKGIPYDAGRAQAADNQPGPPVHAEPGPEVAGVSAQPAARPDTARESGGQTRPVRGAAATQEVAPQAAPQEPAPAPTRKRDVKKAAQAPLDESPERFVDYYQAIKRRNPEGILLMRAGNAYVMLDEDARQAAQVLGVPLTGRRDGHDFLEVSYRDVRDFMESLNDAGVAHGKFDSFPAWSKSGANWRKTALDEPAQPPAAPAAPVAPATQATSEPSEAERDAVWDQRVNDQYSQQNEGQGIPFGEVSEGPGTPEVETPADVLTREGVEVRRAVAQKSGKEYWQIAGIPDSMDDRMREAGFNKPFRSRGEKLYGWHQKEDPTEAVARILKGESVGNAVRESAERERGSGSTRYSDDDIRRAREREDARVSDTGADGGVPEDVSGVFDQDTLDLFLGKGGTSFAVRGVPDEVLRQQVEDAAAMVSAYRKGRTAFVLANDPGTGKTFVLGNFIHALRRSGNTDRILYVTLNKKLIQQIQEDLASRDIRGVDFVTYPGIRKAAPGEAPQIVILDESHSAKNVGRQQSEAARRLIKNARFTIFSSATPFENPAEARYLEPTGIFDQAGGFELWALAYGAKAMPNPNGHGEIIYWRHDPKALENVREANEWFRRQGMYVHRPMQFPKGMVESTFHRQDVAPEWVELLGRVDDAYQQAASRADWGVRAKIGQHRTNLVKRILEAAKVPHAIARAKELIADGKQATIFVETKSDREVGKFRTSGSKGRLYTYPEMREMHAEWAREVAMERQSGGAGWPPPFARQIMLIAEAFYQHGINFSLPSVTDDIASAFPAGTVSIYTGELTDVAANRNLQAWKTGKSKLLVATMAKGGTGLSLHDVTGRMPDRVQVGLNLPWTASQMKQVSGRLARMGIVRPVGVEWLFANNVPFEVKLAKRVGGRMRDMGALVSGVDVPQGKALYDFDFQSGADPTRGINDTEDAAEAPAQTGQPEAAQEPAAETRQAIDADWPFARQYRMLKEQYPDVIVMLRNGDFYDILDEDAQTAAPVMGIVLTRKHGHVMASIPYHAADKYMGKLLAAGHRVAISEGEAPTTRKPTPAPPQPPAPTEEPTELTPEQQMDQAGGGTLFAVRNPGPTGSLFRQGDIRRVPPNPLTYFLTKPLTPGVLKHAAVQYSEIAPDEAHPYGFIRTERTLGAREMQELGAWQGYPPGRDKLSPGVRKFDPSTGQQYEYAGNGRWLQFAGTSWEEATVPDWLVPKLVLDTDTNREVMRRMGREMVDPETAGEKYSAAQGTLFATRVDPQTETPEFRRWFGDSKVVDRFGRPRVMYHGTLWHDGFTQFERTNDIGFHFGTLKQAHEFTAEDTRLGGRIMPAYLSIQNPARLTDLGGWNPWDIVRDLEKRYPQEFRDFTLDYGEWVARNVPLDTDSGRDIMYRHIRAEMERRGFDGIVYRNHAEGPEPFGENEALPPTMGIRKSPLPSGPKYAAIDSADPTRPFVYGGTGLAARDNLRRRLQHHGVPQDSYIAFRPEQIKSATGNRGTFDADNPDIRFAVRQRDLGLEIPWEDPDYGKYINSVNITKLDLSGFDDPQSVLRHFREIAKEQSDEVRAVQTWDKTKLLAKAKAAGITPRMLRTMLGKNAAASSPEEIVAVYGVMLAYKKAAIEAGVRYANTADVQDFAEMLARQTDFETAWLVADGQSRRAGQVLQAHKMIRQEMAAQDPAGVLLDRLMKIQGNISDAQWDAIREAGNDPVQLYKILNEALRLRLRWGDKLHAFLYFNMLSGLTDDVKNITANAIFNLTNEAAVRPIAAGIDALRGGERVQYAKATLPAQLLMRQISALEIVRNMSGAWGESKRVFRHGFDAEQAAKLEVRHVRDFPDIEFLGKTIPHPLNWPTRLLGSEDAFARTITKWEAINEGAVSEAISQLRRQKGKPTTRQIAMRAQEIKEHLSDYPEIIERALAYGDHILLTDQASRFVRQMFNAINAELVGGWRPVTNFMPFKGVPTNIMRLGSVYGPGGFVNLAFKGKNMSRYDQNLLAARAIVGTTIMLGVYAMAKGLRMELDAEPPERRGAKKALWQAEGRVPWSARINGRAFSLQLLGPLAPPIYAAAAAVNADADESVVLEGMRGLFAGILDASFLQGVASVMDAIREGGSSTDYAAASLAGQFVPASGLLGNIANATDTKRRSTYRVEGDSMLGPIGRRLASRIPGVRQTIPEQLDPLGRPVPQEPTGWRAFLPVLGKKVKDDPVVREMLRIGYAPGFVGRTFSQDRKEYPLSKSQWYDYQREAGQAVYDALEGLFESEAYKALPDDEERRIEAMKVAERARKPVREEFRREVIPAKDQPEMRRRKPQRKRVERLERAR